LSNRSGIRYWSKAVPEFATAYASGEKELAQLTRAEKWLTNNLPAQLRDGFYSGLSQCFAMLYKQAEALSGQQFCR
jgi:hypothetical protein